MLPDFVDVHYRASTALDRLTPDQFEAVTVKFTTLRQLPVEDWQREGVRLVKAPVYAVRLARGDLNVFFSPQPQGRFLIEDFASQERLDWVAESFARSQKQVSPT
jgi:hypothetical protein